MKKNRPLMKFLLVFGCAMILAIGVAHTGRFLEGPLRFSGLVILLIVIVILLVLYNRKIAFSDNAIEIIPLIGRKIILPYDSLKSVEYIETKISGGRGIRTKVRNIRFILNDGKTIQLSETQIRYKKCVTQLLDMHSNGKLQSKAIKPATRERLLESIK